ncbi:hypothetical protein NM688_g4021 [Phlebia brevispora]|uniref:Uncharacterized protein n=1 Tax=Phlebia brevispora TaxID=194682 RepID=A0ACC1T463_9APHY|nr:hypothetical protein NM688_g4021 [Phlebia brevispora]
MDRLYALLLVQLSQARWCLRVMAIVRLSIASLPIINRRTAPHTKPGGSVTICALRNKCKLRWPYEQVIDIFQVFYRLA